MAGITQNKRKALFSLWFLKIIVKRPAYVVDIITVSSEKNIVILIILIK